jgi:hypothetical protein
VFYSLFFALILYDPALRPLMRKCINMICRHVLLRLCNIVFYVNWLGMSIIMSKSLYLVYLQIIRKSGNFGVSLRGILEVFAIDL